MVRSQDIWLCPNTYFIVDWGICLTKQAQLANRGHM